MQLHEKIQKLRKGKGLTQEQFAEMLYVSRTAVSKWETGRGTPSIDSLQAIANICQITLDDLLQTEEIVDIAKKENAQNIKRLSSFFDGIVNVAAILSVILPLYMIEQNGIFHSVPLYQFDGWMVFLYWLFPALLIICGAVQIIINKKDCEKAKNSITVLALIANVCAIVLLILSGQPYPAILFFVFFLIKMSLLFIKQK